MENISDKNNQLIHIIKKINTDFQNYTNNEDLITDYKTFIDTIVSKDII